MAAESQDQASTQLAELAATARAIIDANVYMVLGTADEDGQPWASPVFFGAKPYIEFYWMSSPEVTHSRNLAQRPQLSIVVFDSQTPVPNGQAVYMTATAEQLAGEDVERGLEFFPGPPERGARAVTADALQAPSPYRLYRATVSEHSMLCPRESGQPCVLHGRAFDHRTAVLI